MNWYFTCDVAVTDAVEYARELRLAIARQRILISTVEYLFVQHF
jgi:hypothetical protein